MLRKASQSDADRNYRRGAVMGLTVAEAFMLIAFALLMLLALWRFEAEAEQNSFQAELQAATEELADLRAFRDLPVQERETLISMAGDGRLQIARALRDQGFVDPRPEDVRELVRRLNLLEQADLRRLIDAATVWRAEERSLLLDFVALEPDQQSISDIISILEDGVTPEQIRAALSLVASLNPTERSELDALRDSIRARLGERLDRQSQLADATQLAIGSIVESLGGQIDETGIITLPDEILFARGSAEPTSALHEFLAQACPLWFEALRNLPFDVHEVRIEGHASSDWFGADVDAAFFNNLSLSQRRAGAVLESCLRRTGQNENGHWARERATAVGYSSSRIIRDAEGQENAARSRRVVFSASVMNDDIISDIGEAVEQQIP